MTRIATLICVLLICAGAAVAQPKNNAPVASAILTIDPDRLFEDSNFGRQIIEEIEARGASLSAENKRIQEELAAEEKELTDLRSTIDPVEFRELADAFDAKVQETRRTQDAKSRDLNTALDQRRVFFLNATAPILEQLMREAGAVVVVERRAVFISSNAVDITDIAIERLNVAMEGQPLLLDQN